MPLEPINPFEDDDSDSSLVPSPLPIPIPPPPSRPPPPSTIPPYQTPARYPARYPYQRPTHSSSDSDHVQPDYSSSSTSFDQPYYHRSRAASETGRRRFSLTSRSFHRRKTLAHAHIPQPASHIPLQELPDQAGWIHNVRAVIPSLFWKRGPPNQRLRTVDKPTCHSVHVHVTRWVLEGNGSGIRKQGRLKEMGKKSGGGKTVWVEGNVEGLPQTVLFASDNIAHTPLEEPYRPTEFITIDKDEYVDKQLVVYQQSQFEISVIGMSLSPVDFGPPKSENDILMYSMQREHGEQGENADVLPYIHYDPLVDGQTPDADQFISVPASKSLFMASDGSSNECRRSVNFRFKILQLDKIDESMRRSISAISQLGNHIGQYAASAPLLGLLSPALSLATCVSKQALDSHSKADKVITIDANFLLAEKKEEQGEGSNHFVHQAGEYLRFGYYFFLNKKVDAKLYASFRTFPNVELMMKRTDIDKMAPNERLYFPLTGVSYLVIRVTPRVTGMKSTRKPIRLRHVQRLEELMKSCTQDGVDADSVVERLADLADEVGIGDRGMSKDRASRSGRGTNANGVCVR